MNMPKPTAAAPKFSLACPHCSAVLKAGVNLIGRRLNCPQCKEPIEIQILAVNPNAPSPTETVAAAPVPDQLTPAATVTTKTGETTLLNSHPKMFRSNPVGFVIAVLLCLLFGLRAIILLYWYIKCLGATLTVTNMKTVLRKGLLSKYTTEVWHRDVRNVQIQQSFFQRMFGVGRIMISSAGQGGIEIDFVGVPNPSRVKEMIDTHRNS